MHIVVGVIESPWVITATWVMGGGGIAIASRGFVRGSNEEHSALVGVFGAFMFAAQMINFTIPGSPVSAHLTGTALLTILLGPAAAIVVCAAVLLVQCLLFQDGGVLAYGANVCNLALLPAVVSALILRATPVKGRHRIPVLVAIGIAGVAASSLAISLELIFGSKIDAKVVASGLLLVQGGVAAAEGVITAIAFVSIRELLGGRIPLWLSPERVE